MTVFPRLAVPALALGVLGMAASPAAAGGTAPDAVSVTETAPAATSSAPGYAVAGAGVLAVVGSAVVARRRSGGIP
ncbi:hypothetical protein ACH9D2_16810 [Kocuria sp. M4R2S49]|uniref:hypothetical protein n=1 Tax=Kocuria rhizosphaericola TaxID=3376284 RepID=UPI0037ADEC2F